jgi:putative ABC transport system ATP-binding protein
MNETTRDRSAVEAFDVVKLFDGGVVRALDGLNLRIERGEFVAITGPSGCGKSTLIHLIASLDTPTSGRILVNGRDVQSRDKNQLRRREVGLVFQLHNLLPHLNSLENVEIAMFGNGQGYREQRERARELLEEMGLSTKVKMTPPRLSGGERQRLAIARALANHPSIILADEPTGSLDSASVDRVLEVFRLIREERGVTILMATHDTHVAGTADRIIHMRDGRAVENGQPPSEGERDKTA